MKIVDKILCLIALFSVQCFAVIAEDSLRLHVDLPYLNPHGDEVRLDLFYSSTLAFRGSITVECYKYIGKADSLLVLNKRGQINKFKGTTAKIKVDFGRSDTNVYVDRKFFEVLKRAKCLAPGPYKIRVVVRDSLKTYQICYYHEVDSIFSPTSVLRKDMNRCLISKHKFQGVKKGDIKMPTAGIVFPRAKGRMNRMAKNKGLTSVQYEKNGKEFADMFFEDWFVGRYEVNSNQALYDQIKKQEDAANADINSLLKNDLDHPSLFSQSTAIGREKKERQDIEGEIGLTTNLGTAQEPNSNVDNNYYEVRGRVEVPIAALPVELEGLYTSQDAHRQIKSSYFRIHYDVNKIKEELKKNITAYNTKFLETKSKNLGMEHLYGAAINKLTARRDQLKKEMDGKEKSTNNLIDTSGMTNEVTGKLSSETSDLDEKRKQIDGLEQKIEKYKGLVEQNKKIDFFDSCMGYAQTRSVTSLQDMSYKQMMKKGESLLPDGKARSLVSGLTSFDAGIFSKSASKYTMAGQQIKGLDVGYDLGFCEASATAGKTEFIGRDGSLDKYTSYSGAALFKLCPTQKASVIYYGYSPDKTIFKGSDFYKNVNIAAPTFFRPVHIIATTYDGSFSKYLTVGAEVASSFKERDKDSTLPSTRMADRNAYHFEANGAIPNTAVAFDASFDKTGKDFENNTLPFAMKGMERYRIGAKNEFFRSFLSVGIEYNLLIQNSLDSKNFSTKWGFELRTNSRRYPSLALSYKPFTTFRSYSDTLNVPQRPSVGSVAVGKLSYAIKKQGRSVRLSLLYNENRTLVDTIQSGSKLVQASCIYADKKLTNGITLGYMTMLGTDTTKNSASKTDFLNVTSSYQFSRYIGVSLGQDFGRAAFGLCRYAITSGIAYKPQRMPVSLRLSVRYNVYKQTEVERWKQISSAMLDIGYNFKIKNPAKT